MKNYSDTYETAPSPAAAAKAHAELIKEHVNLKEAADMHSSYVKGYVDFKEERFNWKQRLVEAASLEEISMIISEFEDYNSLEDDDVAELSKKLPIARSKEDAGFTKMLGKGRDKRLSAFMSRYDFRVETGKSIEEIKKDVEYDFTNLEEMQADEQSNVNKYTAEADATAAEIKDYSDRFINELHVSALAMAALDGVDVNHPNAIKVKR